MSFPTTFVLLQQEAYLAHGSLSIGLTALRNATFPDNPRKAQSPKGIAPDVVCLALRSIFDAAHNLLLK